MILVWILCILKLYVSCHYPVHVDLEKLGEINFNSVTYKILRPTTHTIKESMPRRDTGSFTHRSRLRHHWSGLRKRFKNVPHMVHDSFRKTDSNNEAHGKGHNDTTNQNGTEGLIVFSMYCPFLGQLRYVRRYNTVTYEPMDWWPWPDHR